ncbi:hypothetical protein CSUI_006729, partial [Cystoisospora suis]
DEPSCFGTTVEGYSPAEPQNDGGCGLALRCGGGRGLALRCGGSVAIVVPLRLCRDVIWCTRKKNRFVFLLTRLMNDRYSPRPLLYVAVAHLAGVLAEALNTER